MTDLATEQPVDLDELADEDVMPDDDDGVDANGRRESPILTALRRLGPATAREIADELGRDINNVSTRLRQIEDQGRVHRTGRMVNPAGARGGPQVQWEIMPEGGEPTGPTDVLAGTGSVDDRLRRMAEQIGRANGRVETLENELAGARGRADRAEQQLREAERRRQDAERRVAAVATGQGDRGELLAAQERVRSVQEQRAGVEQELTAARRRIRELETAAAAAPAHVEGGGVESEDFRRRYFDLLLDQAAADGAGEHVYDRIERLLDGGAE